MRIYRIYLEPAEDLLAFLFKTKASIILLLFLLVSCRKDPVEQCPCYAEMQSPIYKGCEEDHVYGPDHDCGVSSLYKQIYETMKYPEEAMQDSVEGRIMVAFDIFEDGSMGNYEVVQDTLGHGLAEEAVRCVQALNIRGFCPARENCEPVVFRYLLPVLFVLE